MLHTLIMCSNCRQRCCHMNSFPAPLGCTTQVPPTPPHPTPHPPPSAAVVEAHTVARFNDTGCAAAPNSHSACCCGDLSHVYVIMAPVGQPLQLAGALKGCKALQPCALTFNKQISNESHSMRTNPAQLFLQCMWHVYTARGLWDVES